jgi:hypothetical protein
MDAFQQVCLGFRVYSMGRPDDHALEEDCAVFLSNGSSIYGYARSSR